jgi:UDP-N-acetylmuramoylalanine-D-glutamate ligase
MSGLPDGRSFRRIVWAVGGSSAGGEAARQAAILARRDAELLLVGTAAKRSL